MLHKGLGAARSPPPLPPSLPLPPSVSGAGDRGNSETGRSIHAEQIQAEPGTARPKAADSHLHGYLQRGGLWDKRPGEGKLICTRGSRSTDTAAALAGHCREK